MIHDPIDQDHTLQVRQEPSLARVALGKEKDRKPIDPPPIIQLRVSSRRDPAQNFLQSPYYFMSCALVASEGSEEPKPNSLMGTVVSSLHRLKDTDNNDGGFFIFGDLSVRTEGTFRLNFMLYQMQNMECIYITNVTSAPFSVFPSKNFPGMSESTFLTRSFSDQGVRLRLRKDSRSVTTRKRNAESAELGRAGSSSHSDRKPSIPPLSVANYSPVPRQHNEQQSSPSNFYAGSQHQQQHQQFAADYTHDVSHKRQRTVGVSLNQSFTNYAPFERTYQTTVPSSLSMTTTMPPNTMAPYLQGQFPDAKYGDWA